jgi:hypothetical protein
LWAKIPPIRGNLAHDDGKAQARDHSRRLYSLWDGSEPDRRHTADVRFLEPPLPLPGITEMLWWHPRHTADPAHAWLRARIAEIAAELDPAAPAV